MLMRRIGRPGLLGTMARTAVIAGTATATANALNRRQQRNAVQEAEATAYEQQPVAGTDDVLDGLTKLAALHDSGSLSDAEFAAAKQRLLQGT